MGSSSTKVGRALFGPSIKGGQVRVPMKSSCRGVGRALFAPNIKGVRQKSSWEVAWGSFWSWELLARHK